MDLCGVQFINGHGGPRNWGAPNVDDWLRRRPAFGQVMALLDLRTAAPGNVVPWRLLWQTVQPCFEMKPWIWIAALFIVTVDAWAQTPTGGTSSAVLQSCFMGTPEQFWTGLKLTKDQTERLSRVQDACKKECDLPSVEKDDNPISHSDGDMIMAEVKNILTMDQYAAWQAYCKGAGGDGTAPK